MKRYDLVEVTNIYRASWTKIGEVSDGDYVLYVDAVVNEAKAKTFDNIKAILKRDGMVESADVAWSQLEAIADVVLGVE